MVLSQTVDRIFMILFFVTGLIIFAICESSFNYINEKCTDSAIQDGLTAIATISAVMMTMALSYFICGWKGNCYSEGQLDSKNEVYLITFGIISLTLFLTLLVVGIKISKSSVCKGTAVGTSFEDGKQLEVNVWSMFSFATLMLISSGFGIFYMFTKKVKNS